MASAIVASQPLTRDQWVTMRVAVHDHDSGQWVYSKEKENPDHVYNTAFIETFRNYDAAVKAIVATRGVGHPSKMHVFLAFPHEGLEDNHEQHVFWFTGLGGGRSQKFRQKPGDKRIIAFPVENNSKAGPAEFKVVDVDVAGYIDIIYNTA